MNAEPWLLEQQYRAALERDISRRPVCADCGETIDSPRCFPVEEGYLCRRCTHLRMIDTDMI